MKNCFSPEERKEKIEYLLSKDNYSFDDLVLIVTILRSEGGCPWDMEQTHKSLRRDFIEETYEVIEAIDTDNPALLREELGDVMLQVVFHADIEREEGRFDISGVASDICAKLIHRHPHVFGEVKVSDADEVLRNWDKIKGVEKQRVTHTDKLRSIPPMLPALMRASKIAGKAFKDGYEFGSEEAIKQEMSLCLSAIGTEEEEQSLAKLSFLAAILSKKHGGDLEAALQKETDAFINQYKSTKIMEEKK